jgi:hypothetical protein
VVSTLISSSTSISYRTGEDSNNKNTTGDEPYPGGDDNLTGGNFIIDSFFDVFVEIDQTGSSSNRTGQTELIAMTLSSTLVSGGKDKNSGTTLSVACIVETTFEPTRDNNADKLAMQANFTIGFTGSADSFIIDSFFDVSIVLPVNLQSAGTLPPFHDLEIFDLAVAVQGGFRTDNTNMADDLAFVAFGRLGVRAVNLSDPESPDIRIEGSFESEVTFLRFNATRWYPGDGDDNIVAIGSAPAGEIIRLEMESEIKITKNTNGDIDYDSFTRVKAYTERYNRSSGGLETTTVEININRSSSDWSKTKLAIVMGHGGNSGDWLPEVEDEVVVSFQEGDLERPTIAGSVWSGKDGPGSDDPKKGSEYNIKITKTSETSAGKEVEEYSIKLKVPQIRDSNDTGDDDDYQTSWTRIAVYMGVANRGNWTLPEVDDEIEVSIDSDRSFEFNLTVGRLVEENGKYNWTGMMLVGKYNASNKTGIWGSFLGNIVWDSETGSGIWTGHLGSGVWSDSIGAGVWGANISSAIWGSGLGDNIWGNRMGSGIWGESTGNGVWSSERGGDIWGSGTGDGIWGLMTGMGVWGSNIGGGIWGSLLGSGVWGGSTGGGIWGNQDSSGI